MQNYFITFFQLTFKCHLHYQNEHQHKDVHITQHHLFTAAKPFQHRQNELKALIYSNLHVFIKIQRRNEQKSYLHGSKEQYYCFNPLNLPKQQQHHNNVKHQKVMPSP